MLFPGEKNWKNGGAAVNWKTQKAYRRINAFLLDPDEYATFNQIKESSGKVKIRSGATKRQDKQGNI